MTRTFDRAFVAMGVDAKDLTAMRGRSVIYAGLIMMAAGALLLGAAIISNIAS
ncbi:hypothetical protein [Parvularcula marina]|uniref:hypothetical protein n=1 Tax=Parvularcula marina TaxID=2292771 RepID=UPI001314F41F|nr:hypothetical protein [Parvularcula marina]